MAVRIMDEFHAVGKASSMGVSCANRIENEIQCFVQALPVGKGCVTPIKQRALREADDDVRYVRGAG